MDTRYRNLIRKLESDPCLDNLTRVYQHIRRVGDQPTRELISIVTEEDIAALAEERKHCCRRGGHCAEVIHETKSMPHRRVALARAEHLPAASGLEELVIARPVRARRAGPREPPLAR